METEVITISHPELMINRAHVKSEMVIRVNPCFIRFSSVSVASVKFKKADRVAFVKKGREMWIEKTINTDGFLLVSGGKGYSHLMINDVPLVKYLSAFYNQKPPFRLKVVESNKTLYIKGLKK